MIILFSVLFRNTLWTAAPRSFSPAVVPQAAVLLPLIIVPLSFPDKRFFPQILFAAGCFPPVFPSCPGPGYGIMKKDAAFCRRTFSPGKGQGGFYEDPTHRHCGHGGPGLLYGQHIQQAAGPGLGLLCDGRPPAGKAPAGPLYHQRPAPGISHDGVQPGRACRPGDYRHQSKPAWKRRWKKWPLWWGPIPCCSR